MEEKGLARKSTQDGGAEVEQVNKFFSWMYGSKTFLKFTQVSQWQLNSNGNKSSNGNKWFNGNKSSNGTKVVMATKAPVATKVPIS